MADLVITSKKQSLAEIRRWDFDFTADLAPGVTIESVDATHIPPESAAASPTVVGAVEGGLVPVTLGPLEVVGEHEISVIATLSDGEKSEIRLRIVVDF